MIYLAKVIIKSETFFPDFDKFFGFYGMILPLA